MDDEARPRPQADWTYRPPAPHAHPRPRRWRHRRLALAVVVMTAGAVGALALPQMDGPGSRRARAGDVGMASPLSAAEEASPALRALARRFNPAVALPDADGPWPVDVAYTWSTGADLRARTVTGAGWTTGDHVVLSGARLGREPWGDLPTRDGKGRAIQYWVDAPGDDAPSPSGRTSWRERWRAIAGNDPEGSPFPPTEYAHAFWLDRAHGRLAIQYWFFFPFNEWINHHEGDWEHVQVILADAGAAGSTAAAASAGTSAARAPHAGALDRFRPVGYEFFFHGWRYQPPRVVRVQGADAPAGGAATAPADGDGEHVVVFSGGRGQFLWWGGSQSGGSYPLPARYAGAGSGLGPFRPADDTRHPGRFVPAEAFRVVLLPEPQRLDTRARPELSWLQLPFYAGAPRAFTNPPLTNALGGGGAPLQPARRREWDAVDQHPLWTGTPLVDEAPERLLPRAWRLIGPTADGSHLAER